MKAAPRTFAFQPEERELLRDALALWLDALLPDSSQYLTKPQAKAGAYVRRRIEAMQVRLKEPGAS